MAQLQTVSGHYFLVDDEDVEKLHGLRLYAVLAVRAGVKRVVSITARRPRELRAVAVTRRILSVHDGMVVDHVNGDPTDNRKENLRICTEKDNGRNARRPFNARSPYKGVAYRPSRKKTSTPWVASIRVEGHHKSLGYYSTPWEAHLAFRAAASMHYGEFARFD